MAALAAYWDVRGDDMGRVARVVQGRGEDSMMAGPADASGTAEAGAGAW